MKAEHISTYKLEVDRQELVDLMHGLQYYCKNIRESSPSASVEEIEGLVYQLEELLDI